jgi:hypothetical protein
MDRPLARLTDSWAGLLGECSDKGTDLLAGGPTNGQTACAGGNKWTGATNGQTSCVLMDRPLEC